MSEVMPEDRPSDEQFQDDERFDGWLIAFERRLLAKSTPQHKVMHNNAGNQSQSIGAQ